MSRESVIHAWQITRRSNVLDFDGVDDYILIGNDASIQLFDNFTFEAWIKWDVTGAAGTIWSSRTTGGGGWILYKDTDNQMKFLTFTGGAGTVNVLATWTPTAGQVYHVAMTVDGGTATLYVDGYFKGSVSATIGTAGSSSITIGRNIVGTSLNHNGVISDVRLWDSVRTQIEISQYKNQSLVDADNLLKQDIDTSDLVGYWPLNEGTGLTAIDYSGNSNDGALTNFGGSFWLTTDEVAIEDREYKGHTSKFQFTGLQESINSAPGAIEFTLPNITDGQGNEVFRGLESIELQLDLNTNTGTQTLFRGLSRIVNERPKNVKDVRVTALGVTEALTRGYSPKDEDGTYNFRLPGTGTQSIEQCIKDLVLSYNNQNPKIPLTYTDTSIEATGKNISITFYNPKDFIGSINRIWQHTDEGWVWYIDQNNTVYLKEIPDEEDYIFTYGKDFINANSTIDATKIINRIRITNGTTNYAYTNESSIATYGQGLEVIRDERLSADGMDDVANNILDSSATPNNQIGATIIDITAGGSYNIFQGLIGKTFAVVNTDETIRNKVITNARLYPEQGYAQIIASDKEQFVSRELKKLKDDQFTLNFGSSSPDTYTERP